VRILGRYILRVFSKFLSWSLLAFLLLFVVVDLVENIDRFVDRRVPPKEVGLYYLYYLPYILVLVLPVGMLLSALFSVGQLSRSGELVAMRASGLGLKRAFLPLLAFAFLVSVFAMAFGEMVVPEANDRRMHLGAYRRNRPARLRGLFLQEGEGTVVFVGRYDAKDEEASDVSVQQYRGDHLYRRIDAKRMIWKDGRWVLYEGWERTFGDEGEVLRKFEVMDAPIRSLLPEDFARGREHPERMGFWELRRYIGRLRRIGRPSRRWEVDLHLKISFPFANLILVLLGLPLGVGRRGTGKVVGFGLSLLVSFLYYSAVRAGQVMGREEVLPPALAAWLGNIIFGGAGAWLFLRME